MSHSKSQLPGLEQQHSQPIASQPTSNKPSFKKSSSFAKTKKDIDLNADTHKILQLNKLQRIEKKNVKTENVEINDQLEIREYNAHVKYQDQPSGQQSQKLQHIKAIKGQQQCRKRRRVYQNEKNSLYMKSEKGHINTRSKNYELKDTQNENYLQTNQFSISQLKYKRRTQYPDYQSDQIYQPLNIQQTQNKELEPFIILKSTKEHKPHKIPKKQTKPSIYAENIGCEQKIASKKCEQPSKYEKPEKSRQSEELNEIEQLILTKKQVKESRITLCEGVFMFSFSVGNRTIWIKTEDILKLNPQWLGQYYAQFL